MTIKILGVMGQAGSGKDAVADFLVHRFGFVKIALADPLKRICRDVYDFSDQQLWGPSEYRNAEDPRYGDLSPRVALQTLGTEWGRKCYQSTWIGNGLTAADKLLSGKWKYSQKKGLQKRSIIERILTKAPAGIVIPDIRFRNEVHAVRNRLIGYVVKIKRPGKDGTVGVTGHASEIEQQSIDDKTVDYVIENNKDLEHLYDEVEKMMSSMPRRVLLGG